MKRTCNQLEIEKSWTVYMNVFSVLVVLQHVRRTGGIKKSIWVLPYCCNRTDGWLILVINLALNVVSSFKTRCRSIVVTLLWIVQRLVPSYFSLVLQLQRSNCWWLQNKIPKQINKQMYMDNRLGAVAYFAVSLENSLSNWYVVWIEIFCVLHISEDGDSFTSSFSFTN